MRVSKFVYVFVCAKHGLALACQVPSILVSVAEQIGRWLKEVAAAHHRETVARRQTLRDLAGRKE